MIFKLNQLQAWPIVVSAILFLLTGILPVPDAFIGLGSFLPLHTAMEIFSIIIASLVFTLGWNSYQYNQSLKMVIVSVIFLSVAMLDFGHTISYKGMPDFITPGSPQKGLVFWIAARLAALLGISVLVFASGKKQCSRIPRHLVLLVAISGNAVFFYLQLYFPNYFPVFFIEGEGLTTVKIEIEYFIIFSNFLLAVYLFSSRPKNLKNWSLMTNSLLVMALSELCFTLYVNISDTYNILGHVYKVYAYFLVYKAIYVSGIAEPYEDLKKSEKLLGLTMQNYQSLIDNSPYPMITLDLQGKIISMNQATLDITGYSREELAHCDLFCEKFLNSSIIATTQNEFSKIIKGDKRPTLDIIIKSKDNKTIFTEANSQLLANANENIVLFTLRDLTEKKDAEFRINYLSNFNPLTGIQNKTGLEKSIQSFIQSSHERNASYAVISIDVDDLKTVNTTMGHAAGDQVLVDVAEVLLQSLDPESILFHTGSDEFIILLKNITEPSVASSFVKKIQSRLAQPFQIQGSRIFATISAGISFCPTDSNDAETLLVNSSTALVAAKQKGRSQVQFYTPALNSVARERLKLETSLRNSLENKEFVIHYQPQIDLQTGHIMGAEALIRWVPEEGKIISPDNFISIAERIGLIIPLGEWILKTVLTDVKEWLHLPGYENFKIAINLSAVQLNDESCYERFLNILHSTGFPSQNLDIEITESILMYNISKTSELLKKLSDLGITISLDDFGTGYSSLSYLQELPLHILKIDRAFIKDIPDNKHSMAITDSIFALAKGLNLKTVGEGVESTEQLRYLQSMNCDAAQGFFISKPLGKEDFTSLLVLKAGHSFSLST